MELWKKINKLTRQLEFFVVTFVVFLYMLSCYDTLTSTHVMLPLYFLSMSFYYYIAGQLLDYNADEIKGVCKKCDRLVGYKTIHCEIWNLCFHKRDHHCIVTGRCIASNNFKDLYFAIFFMCMYSVCAITRQTIYPHFLFIYKYIFVLTLVLGTWTTFLLLTDKTSKEILNSKDRMLYDIKLSRFTSLFDNIRYSIK